MGKVLQKLLAVQLALKAPKSNFNSFGKYSYRSCEDILEAVKPLLKQEGLALIVADDVVQMSDRYYIKATATLYDVESGEALTASALAREEETKKGMDASQITGTASSYARKYALNGMFAIDDTKDADTMAPAEQKEALLLPLRGGDQGVCKAGRDKGFAGEAAAGHGRAVLKLLQSRRRKSQCSIKSSSWAAWWRIRS